MNLANPALLRSLAEAAAGVIAGWLLASQLEAGDPFHGTLAILPLVVAALRAIERYAVERYATARRPPRIENSLATIVLVGLVAATIARSRLGLVATDWFLAAGFLLLLGHRAARLLLALRPLLGKALPHRPSAAFFWLPFVVYVAIQPWSAGHRQPDGDEPYYLLLAHSLAYDFDLDLANNYSADWRRFMERAIEPQIGDPLGDGGEQYSRHSFLLPLALAPAYRLAGRVGAMTVMAALTAALAWMFLRLAGHYARQDGEDPDDEDPDDAGQNRARRRPGAALLAYGLFALGPPLVLYSYQIWVEVPAALLLALALDGILTLRHRDPHRQDRWHPRRIAVLVLSLALLPVLKIRFVLLTVPLFLLACWRARPPRRALMKLGGGLAVAATALLLFNILRFGNPLRHSSWGELDLFRYSLGEFGRGAIGLFYDAAFGLFASAPIWLLLLPALGLLARQRMSRRRLSGGTSLLLDVTAVSVPYLFFVTPRIEWFGGWSPPFRYALVFLPLLALCLVPLFERRRQPVIRTLIVGLGATTLVLTVLWVVIPGWTYNFADGRTHLLDAAGVRLDTDVARFFPSTVRPRPATWAWLGASLLLIPLGALIRHPSRRRPRRLSSSWGVGLLLLALAGLPAASRLLPSRIVHLEDGFVGQHLGSVYPPAWTLQRPIHTGGWAVPAGGWLVAPVTPGGEQVTITVAARLDAQTGSGRLWLGAGDTHLGTWDVGPEWTTKTLGPFDWPADSRLTIHGDEALTDPVIVDRAELIWQ